MFAVVAAAAAVACKYCWLVVVNAGMVVSCFAHLPAILGWPPHTGIKTICYIYNFKNSASEIIRVDAPNNAIQCDTEYNASARYAKGHGDVCYNYQLRYCLSNGTFPLFVYVVAPDRMHHLKQHCPYILDLMTCSHSLANV